MHDIMQRARAHHALGDPRRLAIVDELAVTDRAVSELATLTRLPSNALAFHLGVLEDAGIISRHISEGDARRRYVTLRPEAAALTATSPTTASAETVLFVCTANSARSQLAAILWSEATGSPAASAGTQPAAHVHPLARHVADEHGLSLDDALPRHISQVSTDVDLVISVCDRANEARLDLAAPRLHWSIRDPAAGDLEDFERVFDELDERISRLAKAA